MLDTRLIEDLMESGMGLVFGVMGWLVYIKFRLWFLDAVGL